ncbi:MAG: hypothetical protein HZC26_03220 [Candidatus Magasanikbacteria bacterium]|nr:hypothetical protein [Candidatus Magasanikbacteria bacterium]
MPGQTRSEELKKFESQTPQETHAIIPEAGFERAETEPKQIEQKSDSFLEESITALKNKLRGGKKKNIVIPQVKDQLTVDIEKIMEEDLKDAFRELDTIQKEEFKIKGEETALNIRNVMRQTKIKAKAIIRLLIQWLKMLPGVNRFFIEQEAKIKADKIMALRYKHNQEKR